MLTLHRSDILSSVLKLHITLQNYSAIEFLTQFITILLQFLTNNVFGVIEIFISLQSYQNLPKLRKFDLQKTFSKLNTSKYRRHKRRDTRGAWFRTVCIANHIYLSNSIQET